MMKRLVGTTSHIRIWITKDTGSELICHGRSWLLWRRWRRRCFKCGTFLTKVTTELRVKPHVRGASVGSKWMRGIKVLIVVISLLKWSRRVALSFLGARRGRSLVWIYCFVDLIHILLKLLAGFSLLVKPCLNGMVRGTHAK
jgi:hypothetical protein